MYKITTLTLICSLLLFSCKEKKKEAKDALTKQELHKELYGSYIGSFSDYEYKGDIFTTMSLSINSITEDGVNGYAIVNGNRRVLSGTIDDKDSSKIVLDLKEPGDKKSDGVFHIVIKGDSLLGTWKPLLSESKLKTKDLALAKKSFKYDPSLMLSEDGMYIDYTQSKDTSMKYDDNDSSYVEKVFREASSAVTHLNASTTVLQESELKNLKKLDLEIIKNTVYARHGYAFKTKGARQFFDFQEWYMPIYDDVENQLSKTEQTNIETLNRFAKYAQDNYDSFGR
ncbi:MAG: hypothetical protein DI598_01265 [Pseudopedobacter saltans]|uniref:YARHG domain-containing protein n=1 Tax=Pseudopedobacter saltans TaxID=151895 RepID=A0A2W5F899_9SPHI|nr:MAG: hypothetical protein DI598_01265 [Pseudopedobacter saltans]